MYVDNVFRFAVYRCLQHTTGQDGSLFALLVLAVTPNCTGANKFSHSYFLVRRTKNPFKDSHESSGER